MEEKKDWTAPTVTEIEVAERTLNSDGMYWDGIDPDPEPS